MEAWIVAALIAAGAVYLWNRWRQLARAEFIRTCTFPHGLFAKLRAKRPQLDTKQMQLVARALREFFLAYLHGGRRYVSMSSQVTDDLWHEFILYTRHYDAFCRRAFGSFLHHTPAVVLSRDRQNNSGLRRVWWYSCKQENINPRKATRLPLLFALDSKLGIADGFVYSPDCKKVRRPSRTPSLMASSIAAATSSTRPATVQSTVSAAATPRSATLSQAAMSAPAAAAGTRAPGRRQRSSASRR